MERETETQRDKVRQIQRERDRWRETDRKKDTEIQKERGRERQAEWGRETDRERERDKESPRERKIMKQILMCGVKNDNIILYNPIFEVWISAA